MHKIILILFKYAHKLHALHRNSTLKMTTVRFHQWIG